MRLHPYQPENRRIFAREKRRLRRWLGPCSIEHFGSTALGIPGKGIIDIVIGFADGKTIGKAADILSAKGYWKDDLRRNGRIFMSSGAGESRPGDVHLHLVRKNSRTFKEALLFRDYLRKNPTELKKYLEYKRKCARTSDRRETYTRRKSGIIREILKTAKKDQKYPTCFSSQSFSHSHSFLAPRKAE